MEHDVSLGRNRRCGLRFAVEAVSASIDAPRGTEFDDLARCCGIAGQPGTRRQTGARLAPWQVRAARELLLSHYAEPINIAFIARRCGVSPGHFIAAFAASMCMTPYQWLIALRIRRAKELLATTALPLAEVAVACGFYDQSHLTRTFVRAVGDPPGRWRRANRSG